jgi:hypothetical protein
MCRTPAVVPIGIAVPRSSRSGVDKGQQLYEIVQDVLALP